MARAKKKQSPVNKKKNAKDTNSPQKSSHEGKGENVIPVEKGEIQGDKHSVHSKDPSFVKITNQDNKEIGVLDKSGITNEVEAGTTIDEGADIGKELQIKALEQFPFWHPRWKELHVELLVELMNKQANSKFKQKHYVV